MHNPLIYPFLLATLVYGIGFVAFGPLPGVEASSLFQALITLGTALTVTWGAVGLIAIALMIYALKRLDERVERIAGILGFMVWVFAGCAWLLTGGWLLAGSIAIPNAWFWAWAFYNSRTSTL